MSHLGALARVVLVPLGFAALCGLIASATDVDPMLAIELATLGVLAAWLFLFGRRVRRALTDTRLLAARSQPIDLYGEEVQLLSTSRHAAFVSGMFQPQVYVSPSMIESLDSCELRGVLLHEYHHRQTRAPLRAVALESWQQIFGWLPPARRALTARLAALEVEADNAAITSGTAPAALASALVKCDASIQRLAIGFSTAQDVRIGELVAWDDQLRIQRNTSIPVEWVAPVSAAIALWACHMVGL